MLSNSHSEKARLNIQISSELKIKLIQTSASQGKNLSTMVRESIEDKLKQIDRMKFDEKMKCAYQELARENLNISEDFKYVDSENL